MKSSAARSLLPLPSLRQAAVWLVVLNACGCGQANASATPLPAAAAEPTASSDPTRRRAMVGKPLPWPGGTVPYDVSRLDDAQRRHVAQAMKQWEDTGAAIRFVPRTDEAAYVCFTGRTDAGNNTSQVGYRPGARVDINITAFWWGGEWMAVHELGHALGFFHEHQRWDRDAYVAIRYENIKPGREHDYDWIPRADWITDATPYDYWSVMHYRVCWAGRCESDCADGHGESACAVIDPVGTDYDGVIGQWQDNRISAGDAARARAVYGARKP